MQNEEEKLVDIANKVFLFDIDGVLCESQKKVSSEMHTMLCKLARHNDVYFVTGNPYTKSVDLIDGPIRDFKGVFSNSADELRTMRGKLIWSDVETDILPHKLENVLYSLLLQGGHKHFGNRVEWRNPRSINFSVIGRNASMEARALHDPSWRTEFVERLNDLYPELEVVIGGSISVDICSRGANKSRACKYVNEVLKKDFIFFGDKTSIGGNDYPVFKYCIDNYNNLCITSTSPENTLYHLDRIIHSL